VKTLRAKVAIPGDDTGRTARWSGEPARDWMVHDVQAAGVPLIDGHTRVYHGGLTKFPRRYFSREKLCLRGITDYWVIALDGQPFFCPTKPIDPGLQQTLTHPNGATTTRLIAERGTRLSNNLWLCELPTMGRPWHRPARASSPPRQLADLVGGAGARQPARRAARRQRPAAPPAPCLIRERRRPWERRRLVGQRMKCQRSVVPALPLAIHSRCLRGRRRSCERTYMKSTGESLSHPETSYGKAAGGNCVVARRGGEQPEADLRSQMKVN
jgi:hypothetical protein